MRGDLPITTVEADHVATITIRRDKRRNALDDRAIRILSEKLRELSTPPGRTRAAVLAGGGDGPFCAGYDISGIDPDQPGDLPLPDERFSALVREVERAAFPVVAALTGDAFGGGLDLALACDYRVARSDIRMAMTPCRLGLVYSQEGLGRFLRKIGGLLTRRLFLTAAPNDAAEALGLGLVDELAENPVTRATEVARTMAENAPLAVAGTKALIARVEAGERET